MKRRKLLKSALGIPLLACPAFALSNSEISELSDLIYLYKRYMYSLKHTKHYDVYLSNHKEIPIVEGKDLTRLELAAESFSTAHDKKVELLIRRDDEESFLAADIVLVNYMFVDIPFDKKRFIKLVKDYASHVEHLTNKKTNMKKLIAFNEKEEIWINERKLA